MGAARHSKFCCQAGLLTSAASAAQCCMVLGLMSSFLRWCPFPWCQAESMVLGQSRGKEVRMMLHHSRNSEQKQWDETVVIALGGMARLLRAHLPSIVGMDRIAGKCCVAD